MTHEDPPGVPARYYAELPRLLRKHGIDPAEVLTAAQVPLERFTEPEANIPLAELERLVAALQSISGQDDLPLELGQEIHLRNHSLVGYAILSSPTIDYALRLTTRFFGLIFPAFRMYYRHGPETVEISFKPTMPMSADCLAFHIELVAVAAHVDIQEIIQGELPPYQLDLSIPPPKHHGRYNQIMPMAKVLFGSLPGPGLRFTLPNSILATQPAMSNQAALALSEQRCRELLDQMLLKGNISDWTRMMLRESNDGLPGIDEIAATLNISPRTLHRHLKKEGLVYRTLCVEERERRARELLASTRLSVTRIAQELGYEDASNFTRAFRSRVGCSPSEFRANAQNA